MSTGTGPWTRTRTFRGHNPACYHYTKPAGAHGRIRTRIFRPATFVRVRCAEGYVGLPVTYGWQREASRQM